MSESLTRNDLLANNFLIKGNNLVALHSLLPVWGGGVKLIYIDPPYNTGSDSFSYNDRFNRSTWLTFMKNRLEVAKDFLRDDGVVFISIDSNQQAQLEVLCDEIFGSSNKLGCLTIINNLKGRSDSKYFATANEYCLVYSKNKNSATISGFQLDYDDLATYNRRDEISDYKEIDFRKTGSNWQREKRPHLFYPVLVKGNQLQLLDKAQLETIYNTKTQQFNDQYLENLRLKYQNQGFLFILPTDQNGNYGRWRWGYEKCHQNIKLNNLVCLKKTTWKIFEKSRPFIGNISRTKQPKTVWYKSNYDTGGAGRRLNKLFGVNQQNVFKNPKSEFFIQDIIQISTNPKTEDLILDFFAGSGTTGQAVLMQNRQDGGNRRFILIEQLDEHVNICQRRLSLISRNSNNGDSFIYCQLAKVNQAYIDQITICQNEIQLDLILKNLFAQGFIKHQAVGFKYFNQTNWFKLTLKDKKQILLEMVDLNQIYLNFSEMDDVKYDIKPHDKKLTRCFYSSN